MFISPQNLMSIKALFTPILISYPNTNAPINQWEQNEWGFDVFMVESMNPVWRVKGQLWADEFWLGSRGLELDWILLILGEKR